MLNQVVLVGRINKIKNNKITLAVPRNYKNAEGVYDTDYLVAKLSETVAQNVVEYCKTGDLVGIKGRLEQVHGDTMIMAEKVSFLSSKKE